MKNYSIKYNQVSLNKNTFSVLFLFLQTIFFNCYLYSQSTDIEMVNVEGGKYEMGCKTRMNNEKPTHIVKLNNFAISKFEITNEQFAKFLNEYNSQKVLTGENAEQPMIYIQGGNDKEYCRISYKKKKYLVEPGFEKYPVILVTWYGANEFCKWAGGRLPTEAEWEYAARGGNKSNNFDFSGDNKIDAVGWFIDNGESKTHQVGQKKPNELGIFDMTGNVAEWCNDRFSDNYYKVSSEDNPKGPASGVPRVIRGGSFDDSVSKLYNTSRHKANPTFYNVDIGFRLVKN